MEFIPYTQALELKELEFNEPCWAWYNIPDEDVRYCYSEGRSPITNIQEEWDAKIDNKPVENIGLPTFSQAFKFFREKYNLLGIVSYCDDNSGKFMSVIDKINSDIDYDMNAKDTYEEAELSCLERLIEILKNKQ
jgi:hypothetical protein